MFDFRCWKGRVTMKKEFKKRITAPSENNRWYGVDNVSYHTKYNMFD